MAFRARSETDASFIVPWVCRSTGSAGGETHRMGCGGIGVEVKKCINNMPVPYYEARGLEAIFRGRA